MKKPNGKKKTLPAPEPEPEPTAREMLAAIEVRKDAVEKSKRENAASFNTDLAALDKEAEPLEQEIRCLETEALVAAIPTLLTLVPEHSRTSCDDLNTANAERGCTRCMLLVIRDSAWGADAFEVEITVRERD